MLIYYLEHGSLVYDYMIAVFVVASADTAKCADRFGGSVSRRVALWWDFESNVDIEYNKLISNWCFRVPGTVMNFTSA